MVSRRGFLAGMLALGAAPAIVRAGSLMPVKARPFDAAYAAWTPVGANGLIAPIEKLYTFDTIWEPGPAVRRAITGVDMGAKTGDFVACYGFTGVMARRNGVPMRVTKVTDWTFEIG